MYVLTHEALRIFTEALIAHGTVPVYGPVTTEQGVVEFRRMETAEQANWAYDRTIRSPLRDLLLPTEDPILYEDNTEAGVRFVRPAVRPGAIVIGVRPYDIAALNRSDAVNADKQIYVARRLGLILIGVEANHEPGLPFEAQHGLLDVDGFDLMLSPCNEGYLVAVGTEIGRILLTTVTRPQVAEVATLQAWERNRKRNRSAMLELSVVAEAVSNARGHPLFQELAERCLGCGACAAVCPTCTCFAEEDSLSLDGARSERRTVPGSCHECEFSRAAGNHNFRPTRADRYRNWVFCKLAFTYKQYGVAGCVDCRRCEDACIVAFPGTELAEPARIANPFRVFSYLMQLGGPDA